MSSWISQAKNYHRKDWLDFLNKTENLINSTIDKVSSDYTNNSLYTDGGIGDLSSIWETPIEKYCLTEIADRQKTRLMSMSMMEKNVTLNKIGDSTTGISNQVSDEVYDYEYEYTEGNNYLNEFQKSADETTTQTKIDSNNYQNYSNNGHNVIYGVSTNHYYDDNFSGLGEFGPFNKINETNKNSILWKTNQLFRERKMNTIISRFHTDNEKLKHNDTSESARSMFGLSHGRNLLTYDAERYGNGYDVNGYNNPYCRVWTHHHQYSEQRSRMMRPFYTQENIAKQNVDLHNWNEFTDMSYNVEYTEYDENKIDMSNIQNKILTDYGWVFNGLGFDDETIEKMKIRGENVVKERPIKWSWKSSDSGSNGWENSVLNNKTGTLNITPKFLGGAEKNIHTKDCMFSIENLAWQGYDPYSFERALSWEQRGPFGGRIMWFPPYGLSFSEDSSVQWNEHSFIGRGESVFTYTNTARSGTLSFMMLVDHPSIIDYATWHNPSDLKDTDIMRFFAGCDGSSGNIGGSMGGSNGILQNFAKPTPLTDEYIDAEDLEAIKVHDNREEKKEESLEEQPSSSDDIEINFYVFFPNNYSGYTDNEEESLVDPMAYLLYGQGAGWQTDEKNIENSDSLLCKFDNVSNIGVNNTGYEMKENSMDGSLENNGNYIVGTTYDDEGKRSNYYAVNNKRWFYRIDGDYKQSSIKQSDLGNWFAQSLFKSNGKQNRYKNMRNYLLNANLGEYVNNNIFPDTIEEDEKKEIIDFTKNTENIYSFSEIAFVLSKNENVSNLIKRNSDINQERIKKLKEYFDRNGDYQVTKIKCIGYSNRQGVESSESNRKKRNYFLAYHRRYSVIKWFKENYNPNIEVVDGFTDYDFDNSQTYNGIIESDVNVDTKIYDENSIKCKLYRSAKVTLSIKRINIKTVQEMNQSQNNVGNNEEIWLTEEEYENTDDRRGFVAYYVYKGYKWTIIYNYLSGKRNRISEIEYQKVITSFPQEKDNFEIMYVREIKNIISYKEWIDLPQEQQDYYERESFILISCEILEVGYDCDDLINRYGYEKIISFEKWENLSHEDKGLYELYTLKIKDANTIPPEYKTAENGFVRFNGFQEVEKDPQTGQQLYININEKDKEKQNRRWYYDESAGVMRVVKKLRNNTGWKANYASKGFEYGKDKNSLRYDQEYYFFKQLEAKHPDVFSSLIQKVQYFDPAFHSMTPEGFMGRLNFLHQCTRQGNTISASDKDGHTANNLAFGRPPFCILRLGDFYYQKIVIRNINITYDPLVLDLNNEGVGVVPLIANVTISFNFIGGGDLTGPVRRLQNAMSFNYYANGRLYDNRADRVERKGTNNWDTMDMGQVDFENSYFHDVKMSTKNK